MILPFPVVLFLFVGTLFALEESTEEKNKGRIDRIEKELTREKELFQKFGEKEKSLLGQLSDLEKEIAEKRSFLRDLRDRLKQTKQELEKRRKGLSELEKTLGEAGERLEQRLRAFYKYAKRGYFQVLATSAGLHDLRRRIKYLQTLMRGDQELLGRMVHIRQRHEQEMNRIREKLETIDRLEGTENIRLASLQKDLDKKVLLLMRVHKEKEFYETAVKELELAAQNLGDTLINLEKRPEKENEKLRLPSGFENIKGRLPLPFSGKIIRRPKRFNDKGLKTHKGMFIAGSPGGEVKAIYPGRVDFSGWLKGYGQIIVINHGSRFFTVSAHLSQRRKDEGEMVRKGEVIGILGDSGSPEGAMLYFEIRRGGKNIDLSKWLKVD